LIAEDQPSIEGEGDVRFWETASQLVESRDGILAHAGAADRMTWRAILGLEGQFGSQEIPLD
jgi:hypothetical protein